MVTAGIVESGEELKSIAAAWEKVTLERGENFKLGKGNKGELVRYSRFFFLSGGLKKIWRMAGNSFPMF